MVSKQMISLKDLLVDNSYMGIVGVRNIVEYKVPDETDIPYYHCQIPDCLDEQGNPQQMFKHLNSYAHKQAWFIQELDEILETREEIDEKINTMKFLPQDYTTVIDQSLWNECKKARLRGKFALSPRSLRSSESSSTEDLSCDASSRSIGDTSELDRSRQTLSDAESDMIIPSLEDNESNDESFTSLDKHDSNQGDSENPKDLFDTDLKEHQTDNEEASTTEATNLKQTDINTDILVNNAGAINLGYTEAATEKADNFEQTPETVPEGRTVTDNDNPSFSDWSPSAINNSGCDRVTNISVRRPSETETVRSDEVNLQEVNTSEPLQLQPERRNDRHVRREETLLALKAKSPLPFIPKPDPDKPIKEESRPKDLLRPDEAEIEMVAEKPSVPKTEEELEKDYKALINQAVNNKLIRYYIEKAPPEDVKIYTKNQFEMICKYLCYKLRKEVSESWNTEYNFGEKERTPTLSMDGLEMYPLEVEVEKFFSSPEYMDMITKYR